MVYIISAHHKNQLSNTRWPIFPWVLNLHVKNREKNLGNANIDCQIYSHPRGIWNLFLIVRRPSFAYVTLRYHLPQSTITKPILAIWLTFVFRPTFPSPCNILDVANASTAKELVYFLHSRGLQLNNFKYRCQETTSCCIIESKHLNAWVLLTTWPLWCCNYGFPMVYANLFHKITNYFYPMLGTYAHTFQQIEYSSHHTILEIQ